MKTLKDVKVGERAVVVRRRGEGAVRRRIMDMGLTRGTEVFVRKVAPLGDPMELNVRGYELSLRRADAEMIEIESHFFEMELAADNQEGRTSGRPAHSGQAG